MRRRFVLAVCLFAVVLFVIPPTHANGLIQVIEDKTILSLAAEEATVTLTLNSTLDAPVNARVTVEILDTDDAIRDRTQQVETIKQGVSSITLVFPVNGDKVFGSEALLWYRLRYRIVPVKSEDKVVPLAGGIISFSEILPNIFDLHIAAPSKIREGRQFRVQVQAVHPLTSRPLEKVEITGEVSYRETLGERKTNTKAHTNRNGYAVLDFNLPEQIGNSDEVELKVTATKGIQERDVSTEIDVDRNMLAMLTTDKPLYQPGQTLHSRAMVFDSSNHAVPGRKLELKIEDPDNKVMFHAPMVSSKFGIASTDWIIPESTPLGGYKISLDSGDESIAYSEVNISRYDLPTFSVEVKPNRAYYLPGQDADVTVKANYLFGQSVKRAKVRVVREEDRHWDFKQQKYEADETQVYNGEFDDKDQFAVHINLQQDHQELADTDYQRFEDLKYAAYVTDPTTNRTEQRRFDVRLTREPIHIYIIESSYRQNEKLPISFFVATSYADGTPAVCDLTVTEDPEESDSNSQAAGLTQKVLKKVTTNQYGVVKVDGFWPKTKRDKYSNLSLSFFARDGKGATGQHSNSFYFEDSDVVRVETDKTVYRPGEPVRVTVTASNPKMGLFLSVEHEGQVLRSEALTVHRGKATLLIPFSKDFQDDVTFKAFGMTRGDESSGLAFGTRTIVYPRDRELKLKLRLDQKEYRPGLVAHANFDVRSADGMTAESSLGVVILDRAVEERFRTDSDFGRAYGFYDAYSYLSGYAGSVGNLSRRDLDKIDLDKPVPPELDLAAEMLLRNQGDNSPPRFLREQTDETKPGAAYFGSIRKVLLPLQVSLGWKYLLTGDYPKDAQGLSRILETDGIKLESVKDPWGTNYRSSFVSIQSNDVTQFESAGPDKRFGTADDFVALAISRPYFLPFMRKLDSSLVTYHARTGAYIRDEETMKREAVRNGVDFGLIRDPWGQPYRIRFGVDGRRYTVSVQSSGPNGRFEGERDRSVRDDFTIWDGRIDYFAETELALTAAVDKYTARMKRVPGDESEFKTALRESGINWESLRDPWGRPLTASFRTKQYSANKVDITNYETFGIKDQRQKIRLTPVTQTLRIISINSNGEDGVPGNRDDFKLGDLSFIESEQSAEDSTPRLRPGPIVTISGAKGAIEGTVSDPNGGLVPGAKVKAVHQISLIEFETETGEDGYYLLKNLPAGIYEVSIDSPGFMKAMFTQVPVQSSGITKLNSSLQVGTTSAVVTVTSDPSTLNTAASSSVSTVESRMPLRRRQNAAFILNATATPRLRQYFPETLVWAPSIETDKNGRAKLDFKMADNITTWKMSVIGSTVDGQIGMVEKDIRSFQPFFIDHDPPRVLTEGDEIALPVVLRNYMEKPQTVNLAIKPEGWFNMLSPASKRSNVPAGDARRETFDFRAVSSVKDGKQRIMATGIGDASDAIEKPVTVHPDGEEQVVTASQILIKETALDVEVSEEALAGARHAELKIYPNLLAHIAEGIDGMLERPHGCGEQTISSTYPNLIALRYLKATGTDSPAESKARKYLQEGYDRLLNYRAVDGGFSYWGGKEAADLALTAYALRFLSDARPFVEVDETIVNSAREWILKQQKSDGAWVQTHYRNSSGERSESSLLTSYIARTLTMTGQGGPFTTGKAASTQIAPTKDGDRENAVNMALAELEKRAAEIDEPYLIASFALAAFGAHDDLRGAKASASLRKLAHTEAGTSYWSLETNTPFYGWGAAGRIETTALAVQALTRDREVNADAAIRGQDDDLVNHGLLFLLRNKDRYGVWYSTQATVNVYDALTALASKAAAQEPGSVIGTPPIVEVTINGRQATRLEMPEPKGFAMPIIFDASPFLEKGKNHVEIRRTGTAAAASVQFVATYYLPWGASKSKAEANIKAGDSSTLRLAVGFDRTSAAINEEITCHVDAERFGFKGYGMLLAEIGLPPGAEVDRSSMEHAMKTAGWDVNQYDILPDRLIVYLWPRAGGAKFDFKFRPRFGMNAQSAPSTLYDYYNPDSKATVRPTRFAVK